MRSVFIEGNTERLPDKLVCPISEKLGDIIIANRTLPPNHTNQLPGNCDRLCRGTHSQNEGGKTVFFELIIPCGRLEISDMFYRHLFQAKPIERRM
jgi:hypothetical protein